MQKTIHIIADNKSILWISLLKDGSISIGLQDKYFLIPGFVSEIIVDGKKHQNSINLMDKNEFAVESLINPHLTFHPPMFVQLGVSRKPKLFQGILGVDFIVENEGRLPWCQSAPL